MEYIIHIIILSAITAISSVSLNLVLGFTGLLSATHAALYGIGEYTVAIMLTRIGVDFFLSMIVAMFISGLVAFLVGLILNRFRDDYYAIATIAFQMVMATVFLYWQSLTRGPLGISSIARPSIFGFSFSSNISFLILSIVILGIIIFVSKRIVDSSFGRVLKSLREDEQAVEVFGYRTYHFKLTIFTIAAMMAACGGALYASYFSYINPPSFYLFYSIVAITTVVFGGLASIRGSVLASVVIVVLPEALRFVGFPNDVAAQMRQVLFGLALILLMLYRPQGLLGEYKL